MIVELYCNGHKIGGRFHVEMREETILSDIKRAALGRMPDIMAADPDTTAYGGTFEVDVVIDGTDSGKIKIDVSVDITTPN